MRVKNVAKKVRQKGWIVLQLIVPVVIVGYLISTITIGKVIILIGILIISGIIKLALRVVYSLVTLIAFILILLTCIF